MKRLSIVCLALIVLLAGGVAADFALRPSHRIAAIAGLCEVGLPNLSRPPEVDADQLRCAVLGPRRTVTGFLESGFELSRIVVGDRYYLDDRGFTNESAWFSGTHGVIQRSGETFRALDHEKSEDCTLTVARVTVEGWMTVSKGSFGHLGFASREFYAYRILSAEPARAEDLAMWGAGIRVCPAGGDGAALAPTRSAGTGR